MSKKKDLFWFIIGIVAVISTITGIAISYLGISKYSNLQNLPEEFKNNAEMLSTALASKQLPNNNWVEKAKQINKDLDSVLEKIKTSIPSLDTSNNKKHYEFFNKIMTIGGYKRDYELPDTITELDRDRTIQDLKDWLNKLKESNSPSNFGKMLRNNANQLEPDYNPDAQNETMLSLLELGPADYRQQFQLVYKNIIDAIRNIINIAQNKDIKKEEISKQFLTDYNNTMPSLLLAQYIVDNISEFANVNLKSIYISSYNPIKLSMIKYAPKINLASQITLCLCFVDSKLIEKDFKQKLQKVKCNPDQKEEIELYLDSLKSRYWDLSTISKESMDDNVKKSIVEQSMSPQFSTYPKELGTTIPLVFIFSSSYKNFSNLLKALYKINAPSTPDKKSSFEQLNVTFPVPIAISKTLIKLNNNIGQEHFTLKREEKDYPQTQDGNKLWEEEKKKILESKKEEIKNIINDNFEFLVELLVFLYDPAGLTECWNNIPKKSKEEKPKDEKSNR